MAVRKERGREIIMECVNCTKMVNLEKIFFIKVGSNFDKTGCFQCIFCGRLHSANGKGITDKAGHPYFLICGKVAIVGDDGKMVYFKQRIY